MSVGEILAIAAAGLAAGTINTVVGSGTLITFPVLLAFGYAPVTANVSNTVGLVPGSVSGAVGYRRELAGQRKQAIRLGTASVLGGITGAVLLLILPASAFEAIVPAFIALALVLIVLQPRLNRLLATRAAHSPHTGRVLLLALYVTGVYGGYFGAAQGVLVIGLLGTFLDETLQRINGAKNVLVGMVNGTAAIVFILVAHVSWVAAALIAVGSTIGGLAGSRFGRRLPPTAMRLFVVAVGVIASVKLIFF